MRRDLPTRLLVIAEQDETYFSWEQAGEAMAELWRELARRDPRVEIRSLRFSGSLRDMAKHVPLLERASKIVFPFLSPVLCPEQAGIWRFLRGDLGVTTPALFYLHGRASAGPCFFYMLDRFLLQHDEFLVTSACEKLALGHCFEKPRIVKAPFLPKVAPLPRHSASDWKSCRRFVYAGRISAQKNLHTLLDAFGRLERACPEEGFELFIYGDPDGVGSPEFGVSFSDYPRFLKKMARDRGIRRVRWMGFVPQEQLEAESLLQPHVFVSPSIHFAENYGLAAYRSLALGNPAVLTDWGGHRDFKSHFGNQVVPVPVHGCESGPYVSSAELCSVMFAAWRSRRSFDPTGTLRTIREAALAELGRSLDRKRDASPLRTTNYYRKLKKRLQASAGQSLFRGFSDPLASPMLRAMGMRSSRARGLTKGERVPWARKTSSGVVVDDPIRGRMTCKTSNAEAWLSTNGFSF